MRDLLGIDSELDAIIDDFSFLASYYCRFHPANAGDVSIVLNRSVGEAVLSRYQRLASRWYSIEDLPAMAALRRDGRSGYRTEGVHTADVSDLLRYLAGRVLLVTRTGAQIPALRHVIENGQDGLLLTVLELDQTGCQIRIIFGNDQYGSLPSIETHVHLLANSICIAQGMETSATVHAHPYHLVSLGRHRKVNGHFGRFNVALYTQIEGMLRNCPELVGIVPYRSSGSEQLAISTIAPLSQHRVVLWMNHGIVVRESTVRQAYVLMDYEEESAKAALAAFSMDVVGLPIESINDFLRNKNLFGDYQELLGEVLSIRSSSN